MKKGRRTFRKYMAGKLFIFLLAFFGVCILVTGKILWLQHNKGKEYQKIMYNQQQYKSTKIAYRRGDILDRNGSFLATSTKVYNLIIEPKTIMEKDAEGKSKYEKTTIDALYKYFALEDGTIEKILKENPSSYYYVVQKKLAYKDVKEFQKFIKSKNASKVVGVHLESEYKRTYPNDSIACHLIGYTSAGNVGTWGIEQQYNQTLNGVDGREYSYINNEEKIETTTKNPVNGNTVYSTIDLNIQNAVDKKIAAFMKSVGAKNVSVVAMNPQNGEILAMGNSSTFNLNDPYNDKGLLTKYSQDKIKLMSKKDKIKALNEVWRNFTVSDTYEPGSTFKPFTVAAALEENAIAKNSTFPCGGYLKVDNFRIHCHNTAGDGMLNVEQALMKSCNVSLMLMAQKLGKKQFCNYQSIFGFGQNTNIDLPGEVSAEEFLYRPDNMANSSLATNSFGQNFNCTMVQLAAGFCSLINGGNYYEPHVVKQIVNEDGGIVETKDKKLVRKTISTDTSKTLQKYLRSVVTGGTGVGCQIEGYAIGGKTGTAEKVPRDKEKYLISFIGFAPSNNPQLVVYTTIDEINLKPQTQTSYAVKLTKEIFEEALPYMSVEKITDKTTNKNKGKVVNEANNGAGAGIGTNPKISQANAKKKQAN